VRDATTSARPGEAPGGRRGTPSRRPLTAPTRAHGRSPRSAGTSWCAPSWGRAGRRSGRPGGRRSPRRC
jgi:hypothetical protein